jgi:hypothetical protein
MISFTRLEHPMLVGCTVTDLRQHKALEAEDCPSVETTELATQQCAVPSSAVGTCCTDFVS